MRISGVAIYSGIGALACGANSAVAQCQSQKIMPLAVTVGDNFGRRVAIHGDVLAGAAPLHDGIAGVDSGSVYLYRLQGARWVFEAEVTAGDGAAGDQFGFWISLSDGRLLVGAKFDDDLGADSGSAYVFRNDGNAWVQEAKLLAPDGADNDIFGNGVALNSAGDLALIGAPQDDTTVADGGSVHVFRREGTAWVHEAKLTPHDALPDDQVGFSVALDGARALLGAWRADRPPQSNSGAAYVFRRDGTAWTQEARLQADDARSGDHYGVSVSLHGDVAVVGADLVTLFSRFDSAGAAYVHRRAGAAWPQERKLIAPDAQSFDQFGLAVQTDGTTMLVGSIKGSSPVGADVGSVYSWSWDGSAWIEGSRLFADDGQRFDSFGCHADFDGRWAVVGARDDDDAGSAAGSVYIFRLSGCDCYADCDTTTGRGQLDLFDFLCFQNRYEVGAPYACDCDTTTGPGVCDIFDFLCFQNAFDTGCP